MLVEIDYKELEKFMLATNVNVKLEVAKHENVPLLRLLVDGQTNPMLNYQALYSDHKFFHAICKHTYLINSAWLKKVKIDTPLVIEIKNGTIQLREELMQFNLSDFTFYQLDIGTKIGFHYINDHEEYAGEIQLDTYDFGASIYPKYVKGIVSNDHLSDELQDELAFYFDGYLPMILGEVHHPSIVRKELVSLSIN